MTEGPTTRLPRWAVLLAGAVVVVVAAVALLVRGNADDVAGEVGRPGSDSGHSEFIGSGDGATDVFSVGENWELVWESSGENFVLELFRRDGTARGVVVDADGRADGSTFVSENGEFYLEVAADGAWTILIVDRSR